MKEDTGQILIVDKIVNNNIVIAKDFRGREVVAIGKGVRRFANTSSCVYLLSFSAENLSSDNSNHRIGLSLWYQKYYKNQSSLFPKV